MNRIEIIRGDITKLAVDAVVNAANRTLLGGGGVDGAIHLAAGPQLLEECRNLKGCNTGEAKITSGYNLPSRFVIHTVGPVWQGGNSGEPGLLRNCYTNSLRLALSAGARTIAFPNISTGVYGYPKADAARIATDAVKTWLAGNKLMEKVYFVIFDEENFTLYQEILHD